MFEQEQWQRSTQT
jgi:hypothetical protein